MFTKSRRREDALQKREERLDSLIHGISINLIIAGENTKDEVKGICKAYAVSLERGDDAEKVLLDAVAESIVTFGRELMGAYNSGYRDDSLPS